MQEALGAPGQAVAVAPGVWRVLAPNPGPYTGPGTNTYLIQGEGAEVAVLDPGPADAGHLAALHAAAPGPITWIWLSHAHPDHAEGVGSFMQSTKASLAAWGQPNQSFPLKDLPAPDLCLQDGMQMPGAFKAWRAWHCPGHASDHVVFWREGDRLLFGADQVLEGMTTSILRPDGDMQAYLDSMAKLQSLKPSLLLPAHGLPIHKAMARMAELVAHREAREAQLLAHLRLAGPCTPEQLAQAIYPHLDARLKLAAIGQMEAHLLRLTQLGLVMKWSCEAWAVC